MNIRLFNETYKSKGGIIELNAMRAMMLPLTVIADHFKVSKERIRQWFKELYGEAYDPRPQRKERYIQSMIDFARFNPEKDFMEAFKGINQDYFTYALSECYTLEIYKK